MLSNVESDTPVEGEFNPTKIPRQYSENSSTREVIDITSAIESMGNVVLRLNNTDYIVRSTSISRSSQVVNYGHAIQSWPGNQSITINAVEI